MKTSTLPPLRVGPRLRKEAERLLREGETLSSFVVDAVEERIRNRAIEAEFLRRGLASAAAGRRSAEYVPAAEVVEELRRRLAVTVKRKVATRKRRPKAQSPR